MSDIVKRKIAALLKLTRKAGCSEAEAMAAAEKAAQLMLAHGLNETDVLFTAQSAKAKTAGRSVRDKIWGALAWNTNTALIYTENGATFVGQGPGPEIAAYLYAVLNRALDREIAAFKETRNYKRRVTLKSRRSAVQDFTDGMGLRLSMKLYELFAAIRSKEAQRAAVVARDAMFLGGRAVTPALAKRRNSIAGALGDQAGGRVNLSHGVGTQSENLRLTS